MASTAAENAPVATEESALDEAERELAEAERELAEKVPKVARQCKGMGARARQLLQFAEKNGIAASAPACTGLKGLAVPKIDAAALEKSQQTRRAAVETRRRVCAELEAALAAAADAGARLVELEHELRSTAAVVTGHAPPAGPARTPVAIENRRAHRVRLERSVDLASDDNFYVGFANDVSVGGLFVATSDPPPRGSVVELVFTLPDGTRVEAEGEVRWTREYDERAPASYPGAGIQFRRIAPEAVRAIARFVEEREALFYDD